MGTKHRSGPGGLFALPPKDFYSRPELHILCGGGAQRDGCRSVARLEPGCLQVVSGRWLVSLYGSDLRLESLSGRRLILSGTLSRVEFERTERREGEL